MNLHLFSQDFQPGDLDNEGFIDEVVEGEEEGEHGEVEARPSVTTWRSEQQLADQDRPPKDTDPYVQVERYHENLPPLLQDEGFRAAMQVHFPPPSQHEPLNMAPDVDVEDNIFDTTQYLAVREWVRDSLLLEGQR